MLFLALVATTDAALSQSSLQYLNGTFGSVGAQLAALSSQYAASLPATPASCVTSEICTSSVAGVTFNSKMGFALSTSSVGGYVDPPHGALSGAQQSEVCRVSGLITSLKSLYDNSTVGLIYVISNATRVTSVYPSFQATTQCSSAFFSSQSYLQADSQPKNVIILFDTSSNDAYATQRLVAAKLAASELIDSLNSFDFVGLVVYGLSAVKYSTVMQAATAAVKSDLKTYISNNISAKSEKVSMTEAFTIAYDIMINSKALGQTSSCNLDTWVLLSSGNNDMDYYGPQQFLFRIANTSNIPIVFSYVVSPGNPSPIYLTPSLVACQTKGILYFVTDSTRYKEIVQTYYGYLNANLLNSGYRVSAPHTSPLTSNKVVTVSIPIYKDYFLSAVAVAEVIVSQINQGGAITDSDLTGFSQSSQLCDTFSLINATQQSFMGGISCSNVLSQPTGLVLPLEANRGAVIGILVALFVLQIFGLGGFWCYKCTKDQFSSAGQIYSTQVGLTVITIPLCIWFFVNLFVGLYSDFVIIYYYEPINGTLLSKSENPIRCCTINSCECTDASGLTTCNNKLARLESGSCANGYYCCLNVCSSYKCGSRKCSSCYCLKSVTQRRCFSACGNCYSPFGVVQVSVTNSTTKTYIGKVSTKCEQNDTSCLSTFMKQLSEPGKSQAVYYNPIDPSQIILKYTVSVVAAVFFSICLLLLFIVYSCMVRNCIKLRKALQESNQYENQNHPDEGNNKNNSGFIEKHEDPVNPYPSPAYPGYDPSVPAYPVPNYPQPGPNPNPYPQPAVYPNPYPNPYPNAYPNPNPYPGYPPVVVNVMN